MNLLRSASFATVITPLLLSPSAFALDEEEGLFPIFIVDATHDQVYRGIDGDEDRTYNQAGEMTVFYDDTLGSLDLDTPTSLHTSPNDFLFISDSSHQRIVTMEDLNDDGTCHDTGEHFVFADSTNASGVPLPNLRNVYVRNLGELWATSSNADITESDAILFFNDANNDGDANDAGEVTEYYMIAPGGAVNDSDPTAVIQHPDGLAYYVENGSSGAIAKGVYCLEDLNNNGVIDAPLEVSPYYLPTGTGMELVALDVDEAGVVYLLDNGLDRIFRLEDSNMDGVITPGSEDCVYYTAPSSQDSPDLSVSLDGHELMALEIASLDQMWLMEDEDDDCSIVHGIERAEAYNDVGGSVSWGETTGIDWDFHGHEVVGTPFCFAVRDRCPCSNDFGFSGCANSTGGGAILEGEGTASVSLDDLAFHAVGMPAGVFAVLFQGDAMVNGGLGNPFFDGLFCVDTNIQRLGAEQVSAGGDAEWGPGLLAGLGEWSVGETKNFQVWYRDVTGPCGSGANTTNGVSFTFEQ